MKNKNKRTSIPSCVAAILFALTSIQSASAAVELAKINNTTVITLDDFNKKYRESLSFSPFKPPSKKEVLERLIKRELGIQEAKRQGLQNNPEIQERMNTVLYHALLEKNLSKEIESINISDSEAQSHYDKAPEIRTSQITVSLRSNATPQEQKQAHERMRSIQQRLADGKLSFSEVAQKLSEDPSATNGGDMDYRGKDRLDPLYYDTALKLGSPGKVSGVFRTPFGLCIVKLTAIRPWEEADKAMAKRVAFEERREKLFEKYMGSLRSESKVAVHTELLKE